MISAQCVNFRGWPCVTGWLWIICSHWLFFLHDSCCAYTPDNKMDGPGASGQLRNGNYSSRCLGFWNDGSRMHITHFYTNPPFIWLQELFTRQPPYHDIRDTRSVIQSILQGPPTRPTGKITCNRLTDQWWEMCRLCWEREPSRLPIVDIVRVIVGVLVHAHFLLLIRLRKRCLLATRNPFDCLSMLPCSLYFHSLHCVFLSTPQSWLSCSLRSYLYIPHVAG